MPPPRRPARTLAVPLLALLSCVGCARSGQLAQRGPLFGSMKESLSRLEYQNQQLRRELKQAQADSNRLAADVEQLESDNRRLQARVDSGNRLGDRGGSADSYALSRPEAVEPSPSYGSPTRPANQPAGRLPFTNIPNRASIPVPSPPMGPDDSDSYAPRSSSGYDSTPRPYLDPPPVEYYRLNPSGARSAVRPSSAWSPTAQGLGRLRR